MNTVVISNLSQLDRFLAEGFQPGDFAVYCDNLTLAPALKNRGIRFSELGELVLHDDWEKVNAWGCGAAAAWVKSAKQHPIHYDFPSVLYLIVSHILVHMVKNLLYARWLIRTVGPERVVVFEDKPQKVYPQFSGNFFLNYFIAWVAKEQGIPCQRIGERDGAGRSASSSYAPSFLERGRIFIRSFFQDTNALFFAGKRAGGIWAYGSLHHLGPVILELRARKIPVFLYDREFNFGQFFFALRNGISYVTPPVKAKTSASERARFVETHRDAILESFDCVARSGVFHFEGFDVAPLFREHVLGTLSEYLDRLAESEAQYLTVVRTFRVRGLLIEEDYAHRGGFLAAFLRRLRIPVFCVAHAATASDFEVPRKWCCVGQSTTFVHSGFDRDVHIARGWDPGRFVLSGVPRYDALLRKRRPSARKPSRPLRLLFCANRYVFDYENPDRYGYLGHMYYAMSEVVKPTAEIFFETLKKMGGMKVILKPHGTEGLEQWGRFVASFGLQEVIRIIRARVSIDRFFESSDAMIVSYWSTAMIEAAIYGLPIIVMDFKKLRRPSVDHFAKAGFCRIVQDADELRSALFELSQRRSDGSKRIPDAASQAYYVGHKDGKGASRVADHIRTEFNLGQGSEHV